MGIVFIVDCTPIGVDSTKVLLPFIWTEPMITFSPFGEEVVRFCWGKCCPILGLSPLMAK